MWVYPQNSADFLAIYTGIQILKISKLDLIHKSHSRYAPWTLLVANSGASNWSLPLLLSRPCTLKPNLASLIFVFLTILPVFWNNLPRLCSLKFLPHTNWIFGSPFQTRSIYRTHLSSSSGNLKNSFPSCFQYPLAANSSTSSSCMLLMVLYKCHYLLTY